MKTRFGIPLFLLIVSCSSDPTVMSDDFVASQCYDLTGDPTTVGMHYLMVVPLLPRVSIMVERKKHIKSMPIFRGKFRLIAGKP